MKRQDLTYIAGNDLYIAPLSDCETSLFLRGIGRNKRIEQRRNGKQSFLSFVRRSVNENALSVKGKIHCLRQPLDGKDQHTDR